MTAISSGVLKRYLSSAAHVRPARRPLLPSMPLLLWAAAWLKITTNMQKGHKRTMPTGAMADYASTYGGWVGN